MNLSFKKPWRWLTMVAMIRGVFGLLACLDMEHKGQGNDIPTKGELEVAFDVNDSLMFSQLIGRFHELYPQALIKPLFLPPIAILEGVRDKQISAMYINYVFDSSELKDLGSRGIKVRSHAIAATATVLIVNPSNPNNRITSDTIKGVFSGNIKQWNFGANIELVMLNNDLAFNHITTEFGINNTVKLHVVKFASPKEVFEYVNRHPYALGFVSTNWIADRGDTLSRYLRHKVKILAVENPDLKEFHFPYQSQIFTGQYPLTSTVMGYDLQGYSGLAQGFLAFCCDQSAQVMVKKSGLSPALPPARTIQFNK